MSSLETSIKINCLNDCKMSGCPGHILKLELQTTADIYSLSKDGERVYICDIWEMRELIRMVYTLQGDYVGINQIIAEEDKKEEEYLKLLSN